ncbi:NTF2- export protein 2 [Coemansia sp. RSA 1722]|nr:NTF2- export protein 2 [Coemansia sp. RSA 485]KAJ2600082.1 NTF2- export protein 2 [Coemansia sp. RSA 1721]KAJ2604860.1 NTF2- export protein 2 [Coemansia sp. RSA 1722]KAJ2638177.1 NTF2- export protein 2 [Coemansia sp. RSA 1286]KAJ2699642.1 NTF2- export protein 2 [Coemansia sp. IMI 203386]
MNVAQVFPAPSETRINQALLLSEKFTDGYYRGFNRCARYYQDTTKVIWNGTAMTGGQFKQMLPEIQTLATHFDVHGLDCHPLGSQQLINVSGLVKLGNRKQQFTQTFIVEKAGTLTYIVSDCFRLV